MGLKKSTRRKLSTRMETSSGLPSSQMTCTTPLASKPSTNLGSMMVSARFLVFPGCVLLERLGSCKRENYKKLCTGKAGLKSRCLCGARFLLMGYSGCLMEFYFRMGKDNRGLDDFGMREQGFQDLLGIIICEK